MHRTHHSPGEVKMEDRRLMQQPCNEDLCEDELGYPKWPDEMNL